MGKKISFESSIKGFLEERQVQLSGENFIYIEILLDIICVERQAPQDGWVLLTQYYKYILNDEFIKIYGKKLYGLRKRCHHLANKLNWNRILEEYFDIDADIRRFSLKEGKLIVNPPKYFTDRHLHYEEIIEKFINTKIIKPFFPNSQKVKYYKVIRSFIENSRKTASKIEKAVVLPDKLRDLNNKKLPLYREKKSLDIPNNLRWEFIYKKMGNGWEKRPVFKIINEFYQKDKRIQYKDNIHIIGEVGQGKSNYKIAETFRLVNEYSATVGIIESKVDDVIKTTHALRKLGIDVVPIIGKANLEKHLDTYIRTSGKKARNIGDFSSEEFKELEFLSGICTVAAITGDSDITTKEFPCTKLYDEDGDRKTCSIYKSCGYFKKFLRLSKAKVWVATPYSLINMTIPKVVDPYERTFYEAFYDLLDIIFIDEADGVQRILDGLFLNKEELFGEKLSILDRFENLDKLIDEQNLSAKESLAYTWQMNYKQLNILIPKINRMIANTEVLYPYLRREIITPFNLFSDLKNGLKVDEYTENELIIKKIESYFEFTDTYDISYESIKHEFNELYNEFIWIQNVGLVEEKIEERIKVLFKKYGVNIPKNKNEKLFYSKFELFIYLVQLDFYFKVLSRDYPIVYEAINNQYEKINVYEGVRKSLRTFLTEPMTGVIFGYKFIQQGKNSRQKLSIFRYSGVGRRLLEHFHEQKLELELQGPAIVLLSGTSVAPGSGHFNLRKTPEYILKSFEDSSKIEQTLLLKHDNDKLIKVSGLNGEDRAIALRKLTKALIRDIRIELKYWKTRDEADIRNRKVLLIVNSYDNCKEVGVALNNSGILYKILSREVNNSSDFTKELLENFQQETDNAEVLVAPLNVISRGYNILNEYGKSYFGSIFFMVRPYMVPDDLESYFQILHSNLEEYIKKSKDKTATIGEVMSKIKKLSYMDLHRIAQNRYWKTLDPEFRKNLAWFTLIPIKQVIGRLQRGGSDCRVFYCDGAFASEVLNGEPITRENSILGEWYKILEENKDNLFIKELYGKFFVGLEELIENVNNELLEV
ncbi:MAG: hypothetical protein E7211_16900 [Clostridium lundense]|nr:hypothetical protein [Clostridium lundense]